MPLLRRPSPFDHPDWVFELKYDGFRSLAVIRAGRCELISRNGHPFTSFTELRDAMKLSHQEGPTKIQRPVVPSCGTVFRRVRHSDD